MPQFAVYSSFPGRTNRWLSAVSPDEAKLRSLVDNPWECVHSVIFFGDFEFPFIVIENERIFLPFSESMLAQRVDKIVSSVASDADFGTAYRFKREWIAENFDVDEMGALPHVHLDRDAIVNIAKNGVQDFF